MSGEEPESNGEISIPETDGRVSGLVRSFWIVVVLFKITLLATTLGGLLFAVRHNVLAGVGLLALGIVSGGLSVHRYRKTRAVLQTGDVYDGTEGGESGPT